jgi:lysophospholipase
MKFLISLIVLSYTLNVFAISELDYKNEFKKVNYFTANMINGRFYSNKLNVYYKIHKNLNASNCLFILPGRSEPAQKYGELVYDLNQTDFGKTLNYFIIDHRGQGASDRMTDKHDLGYVDQFENYVTDLDYFLKRQTANFSCNKKFLFAHSMGAGIGLSFVVKNPNYFDALAISSPMLKIQTKPYPYAVAKTIVASMMAIGRGDEFAIGQKGYNPNDVFADNKFTTSEARFEMTMDLYKNNPVYQLGGVSNKWLFEVMNGTAKLRSKYSKIKAPMKLYRAGIELYSEPSEMHKLCEEALQCDEMVFPNSKHEVINDRDETRDQVISSMIELFSRF